MNRQEKNEKYKMAKQMLIDGKDWNLIMQETGLRLKDLKRVQREEINPHF